MRACLMPVSTGCFGTISTDHCNPSNICLALLPVLKSPLAPSCGNHNEPQLRFFFFSSAENQSSVLWSSSMYSMTRSVDRCL